MDKRFLRLYNEELQYIREMSGEFAAEYPKIAGRLGLDKEGKEVCQDPFVERLLEGFAFLTARVKHKFDSEFPRLTQSLLETVYPQYLAPTPSMLVASIQPDLGDGALIEGYKVPRGTVLRSLLGKGERTACEYRTAHDVTMWPMRITEAEYYSLKLGTLGLPKGTSAQAALRIRIEITAGATAAALKNFSHLDFYIRGSDEIPVRIYEQVIGRQSGAMVRPVETSGRAPVMTALTAPAAKRLGFSENEALLPTSPRTFEGFRLLKECFAFPQRFLFFRIDGLGKALASSTCTSFDVILLFSGSEPLLDGRIDKSTFELFSTPAINLVKRRADWIPLANTTYEYPVIADRTRPLDFEIYGVERVAGMGVSSREEMIFQPFYHASHGDGMTGAYFATHRVPRVLTQKEKLYGKINSYSGSEIYLSIVDANAAPYRTDLKQLAVEVLVTNRHLPQTMALGQGKTDFSIEGGGPITAVRCVTGPTPPRPSAIDGEILWRLVSHLSLNYFSLIGEAGKGGPVAFKELLRLYADVSDHTVKKRIDGILGLSSKAIVRRVEADGPMAFARGLEISVTLDETAFEGHGIFVFGAMLERFFAKYAPVNSFTETVIVSSQRGEVMRWPMQIGKRPTL